MLGGLAAGVTGCAALPSGAGSLAASRENPRRIDVHAHYLPERYRAALVEAGHQKPSGMPGIPPWSASDALRVMDRLRIASAVLSISAPGIHFGDNGKARTLARSVNEDGASAVRAHPDRFGFFASIPAPDIEGSLAELAYAFDVLKADGVVMSTNHLGVYQGDKRLAPIYAELNRRRAVLFIHPNDPYCPCCRPGTLMAPGLPYPMLEFMFETTRSVFNLILSGTLDRYPDIQVIVPHAGAAVPVLADRVLAISPAMDLPAPLDKDRFFAALRGLYFDLAGYPLPRQLRPLLEIADERHILYGSDWPFTPEAKSANLARDLDASTQISAEQFARFMRTNALTLFPRFA